MADGNSGGGNGMLYFIVGALCVVVAIGGFIMFGGHAPNQAKSVDVKIELPKVDTKK